MRTVLIIGAGKSTAFLVKYLLDKSIDEKLYIRLADKNKLAALKLINNHKNGIGIEFDINSKQQRIDEIKKADIVISMLPARFHFEVAKDCLSHKKNLITASYVSNEMQSLNQEVKLKNLLFLNEMGVDPGIDHMSAMQIIDRIKSAGGKMILFESFTGGLIAPECDNNLWNYKFTWNPRNVVLAGQGGAAKFIQEGKFKYIPYNRLFRRTEFLDVDGYGRFEAYANRDSLKYQNIYGLDDVHTMYRGTIRKVGFGKAWQIFVRLGMTDDSYYISGSENMSYRDFINSFLPYHPSDSVELKLRHQLKIDQDDILWEKLEELDLFNRKKRVGIKDGTPAQILQKILMDSWTLKQDDKDMIVMYHKFGYVLKEKKYQIDSTMVCIGEDQTYTAMSKTVGLPVAIGAIKVLNGIINEKGIQIPVKKQIYLPILNELKKYGINFKEKKLKYLGYNILNA
ncbi:MAG: saccharopine dehydrogenase [Flavobacteriaceae bacterium]|nr:saccharopine dehydrogenase [Flavobacteriaceae bacterium]